MTLRSPFPTVMTAISLCAVILGLPSCVAKPQASSAEVEVAFTANLPSGPDDQAWRRAPLYRADLIPQDLVEPRLLEPSTSSLEAQALTNGRDIAILLRWDDPVGSDVPGPARFSDACAIQLPLNISADVPAPQMGEENKPVQITFWRASWQASVDGREDTIEALYPGAKIDHYPFEAQSLTAGSPEQQQLALQYAPARLLGNTMEGPRSRPVQDLIAEGPGTLEPAADQVSTGQGRRTATGWEVVMVRPLPTDLSAGRRTQIAFAIWQGEGGEVGAKKMRSVWIPLYLPGEREENEG